MPSLSVVMIVRNEAARLPACLESIRPIADELVIADTGSTDGSFELARACGAVTFAIPWRDDFAEARNQALVAASGDWLLHIDADEVLDPRSAARVRAIADADGTPGGPGAQGMQRADAIEVTLANYCNDIRAWRWTPAAPGDPMAKGFAGYIRVGLLRLFRNHKGYEYREPVHENITESVLERGGVIRAEPITIHHYGYAASPEEAAAKARFYLEIARRKAVLRPDDPKAWHDLAEQSLACNETGGAEEACRKALSLAPSAVGPATTLANILLNRGELDAARAVLNRLEQAGMRYPHVRAALGAIAYRQGRLEDARQMLGEVAQEEPPNLQALLYLARVQDLLGQTGQARASLEAAYAIAPAIPELAQRLEAHRRRTEAETRVQQEPAAGPDALRCLVEALRLDPEDPLIHNDIGVILAGLGQTDKALQSFERALQCSSGTLDARANLTALSEPT